MKVRAILMFNSIDFVCVGTPVRPENDEVDCVLWGL